MLFQQVEIDRLGDELGGTVLARAWSNRIITVIATHYVGYGLVLVAGIA
jgi:hypothetical protein